MKVVFISNVLNNHNVVFCNKLFDLLKGDFLFIETQNNESTSKGTNIKDYENLGYLTKFNELSENELILLCTEADVVIQGQAPDKYLKKRLRGNKMTFRMSEHIFKGGPKDVLRFFKYKIRNFKISNPNFYYLAASSNLPSDLSILNINKYKVFSWGYFPNTYYFGEEKNEEKSDLLKFIWVGRMINWKHPELILKLCNALSISGQSYVVKVVGDGPKLSELKVLVNNNNLTSKIQFYNNLDNKETQKLMHESDFIFTSSDIGEGWGAVLNEGMAQGCIPIASDQAGSSEFLIDNYDNGFLYSIDDESLLKIINYISHVEQSKLESMKKRAKETINNVWNGEVAAERFINYILNESNYADGPMKIINKEV